MIVADSSNGSLHIDDGSIASSADGYIGKLNGSIGSVTVTGSGSQWNNDYDLYVANYGTGVLHINADATVNVGRDTWIGRYPLSGGFINFLNGNLNTVSLLTSPGEILGTGTINTTTVVSDIDLLFDLTHPLQQQVTINNLAGQNITLNINAANPSDNGILGTGYRGTGLLNIAEGLSVSSRQGLIGYHSSANGTASVTGAGSQWTCSGDMIIGEYGTGTLSVQDGGVVDTHDVYLGNQSGSHGTASIIGAGTKWISDNGDLNVGNYGVGTLNIREGGYLYSQYGYLGKQSGSIGTATVTGTDSQWRMHSGLFVGDRGTGTLNILDGGNVRNDWCYVGKNSGSNGLITVSGAGSTLYTTHLLHIGSRGRGEVVIENGGNVVTKNYDAILIGDSGYSHGVVTITGPGSRWYIERSLNVGESGTGELIIQDGGLFESNSSCVIGNNASSLGTVTVTGVGSQLNCGNLYISDQGTGTLNIENDGVVNSRSTWVGRSSTAGGVINFNVGTLNTHGLLASPHELLGTGTINTSTLVSDIDLVFNQTTGLQQQFTLNSQSDQDITVNIDATDFRQNGYLGAGYRGTGTLTITEDQQLKTGSGILGYHSGSNGTATVSGAGTIWESSDMYVGWYGVGELRIQNGAMVTTNHGHLGYMAGSTGAVTVAGSGSQWDTDINDMMVGRNGDGELSILDGGTVHNHNGYIGYADGTNGTVTVAGSGSHWGNTNSLYVGNYGSGTLVIQDGGSVENNYVEIGRYSGSTGSVTVTGTESRWIGDGVKVGYLGHGSLSISDGAIVDLISVTWVGQYPSSTGVINFNGGILNTASLLASSGDLLGSGTINTTAIVSDIDLIFDSTTGLQQQYILNELPGQNITINIDMENRYYYAPQLGAGYRGQGSLTIADGLYVTSGDGILGQHSGSHGTATVSGAGTRWEARDYLYIGNYGAGDLLIRDGGIASTHWVNVAYKSGSNGSLTVMGPGSLIESSTSLYIGYHGEGELVVKDGGVVVNNNSYVGFASGSYGKATIVGKDSRWSNSLTTYIGLYGIGEVNIDEGGLLETKQLILGGEGTGTLNQNGGMLSIYNGDLILADDNTGRGFYHLNGGTLDMQGNSIRSGSGLEHEFEFRGGTIRNASSIDLKNTLMQQGGTLAPGGSIGQTNILGDYSLVAGTVEIELGGIDNPYDLLTATGDIDISIIGTTLDLSSLGAMAAGSYTIIESTSGIVSGSFERVTGIGLYDDLVDVQYNPHSVTITLNRDFVPGDLNADGFVGLDDLDIILAHWNQTVPVADLTSGDYSCDGYVGLNDLDAVLQNWNASIPAASNVNMPELATFLYMLSGVSILSLYRNRYGV